VRDYRGMFSLSPAEPPNTAPQQLA
jgi:hypothetical protein